jgi:hypothetical protein
MMRVWILLVPLISGCLLVLEQPCIEYSCPDGFACQSDGSGCLEQCDVNRGCATGYYCSGFGECEELGCGDCNGFACGPFGECLDFCGDHDDCQADYVCCDYKTYNARLCPERGVCY